MAATLAQLASDLDWNVELIDGNDFGADNVKPSSIVVVATQGHGDEEVLEAALAANPVFVGLVASRKRGGVVLDYLSSKGIANTQLARIKVPVGIDLGHTTHREVAVSILAELVQMRAAGEFRVSAAPKTSLNVIKPAEVIDLVCGMTVTAEKSNRPYEYEGTTYYFCAPGCRASFEKNPTAYLAQEAKC
jgi:xanthine dehydrogenase accessory factor